MGRTVLARLAVVLSACSAVACTDRAAEVGQNSQRVSVASTADATAAVVDQGRRFRLAWPGAGWKLLHEQEARKLVPEAVAGALSDRGISVVVLVRPADKLSPAAAVTQLLSGMALGDVEVESNETTKLGSRDVRRFVFKGTADGVGLRYAGFVLAHGGHHYHLLGWGGVSVTTADAAWLTPVVDAFSLEDGDVTSVPSPSPLPDSVGPGWRIADGVLESAIAGIRLQPAKGWGLLLGPRLQRDDPEAVAGLIFPDPEIIIHLRNEPVPPSRRIGLLERVAKQAQEELKLPAAPDREAAEIAGQKLQLLRYRTGPHVVHHGVLVSGDRGLHVVARYHGGDAARAAAALAAGLSGISLLSDEESAKLAEDLAETSSSQSIVGSDFAIRAGKYRNFKWRFGWTKPEGFWRMVPAPAARQVNRDAVLYVQAPRLGLHGLLIAEPARGLKVAAYHTRVTDRMAALVGFAAKPAEPMAIDEVEGLTSEGDAGSMDRRLRYRVVTTVQDDRAIQLLVWGWPELMRAHSKQVAAVAEGIELQAISSAVEQRSGVYRDLRMGFEIQPPADWAQEDLTPEELAPRGTFVRWGRDGQWVAVLAASVLEPGSDDDWLVGFIEQALRDEIGPIGRGPLQRATVSVAARSARHLSWSSPVHRIDALLLRSGNTVFGLLAVDQGSTGFDLLNERFVLLP